MSKRLVIGLDGTWNNPYQEKERQDGTRVYKPSNVLKLCRAVRPRAADGRAQITYYDVGVGALNSHPGTSNRILRFVDNKLGGAWGAGFEGNIEDAFSFLLANYEPGDEIFVFGFSRGAGEARGLCRFLEWIGGLPEKSDAYYAPRFFARYLERRGEGSGAELLAEINGRRRAQERSELHPFRPVRVRFLGVWDTVMALGSRLRARRGTSTRRRGFHVGERPPRVVECARQALAIDERRYDFRPEIWTGPGSGSQSLEQRWFAGAHSNIGGGYVHDGLANLALRWLVGEAEAAGLDLDREFLKSYSGYAMDRLYDSRNLAYQLREAPLRLFGGGRGERELAGSEEAGLGLHESVFWRLAADPGERDAAGRRKHPRLEPYRPENLLRYLAEHPELDDRLSSGVLEQVRQRRA